MPWDTSAPIRLTDGFDSSDPALVKGMVDALAAGEHLFLTGPAGSGKTYLVQRIAEQLANRQKVVHITATTGIAATHLFSELPEQEPLYVKGPSTLHSAAMLPWSNQNDTQQRIDCGKRTLQHDDVLVIDEISMLDAKTFGRLQDRLSDSTAILAIGDFYQLPPVRERNGEPDFVFRDPFFESFRMVDLGTVYRQSNPGFVYFLDHLRHGQYDREFLGDTPETFRSQYPVLYGTNREAATRNEHQMGELEGPIYTSHRWIERGGNERPLTWFKKYTRAEECLEIKEGMRILWIQNVRSPDVPAGIIANGDLGTVLGVSQEQTRGGGPSWVNINFDRFGTRCVKPHPFQKLGIRNGNPVVVYDVRQYAFVPAYGLTVHKAQGMTLDALNVDGNRINFAAGQVYVALSRCRTHAGLRVQNAGEFAPFTRDSVEEYYATADRLELG